MNDQWMYSLIYKNIRFLFLKKVLKKQHILLIWVSDYEIIIILYKFNQNKILIFNQIYIEK
jgi:hypothetical protein